MMAVRCNSCIRGHSAISRHAVDAVLSLIKEGITPVIPLRGSISASGDLMPLSYVAGAIEGSPDVFVRVEDEENGDYVTTADVALAARGLAAVSLDARDALALVNGTSTSAAVGSLAFYEAGQLAILSACITALISEAMTARTEWSHRFLSDIRPHPGQYEASHITRSFLRGSELVSGHGETVAGAGKLVERFEGALAQDRYPLRTSPQWLGPQFEDLLSAHSQIAIELNSTSDNPSTDPKSGEVYSGGNFQATSVTSAVEKIRIGMQMVGKMLFSQTTEMLNHNMSSGLPANLAADDPSHSFCLKGLDINIAAYQSELAFLANPMSNHVQSAEMHNQAINSLALLSSRYTFEAVELVALMSASALYAACQGVDLRVLHATFVQEATAEVIELTETYLAQTNGASACDRVRAEVFAEGARVMRKTWWEHGSASFEKRCEQTAWAFVLNVAGLDLSSKSKAHLMLPVESLSSLQVEVQKKLLSSFLTHRDRFLQSPTTAQYLGKGTSRLYTYVRKGLGVPMHQGLDDHPSDGQHQQQKTIGSRVSVIYEAIRDGSLFSEIVVSVDDLGLRGMPN
jgi:phenylalanine ammonia-lyase